MSSDSENDECEAMRIRKANIKAREEYMAQCAADDPDFAAALDFVRENKENIKSNAPQQNRQKKRARSSTSKEADSPFRYTGQVPKERRKSSRLSKGNPKYTVADIELVESTSGRLKHQSDSSGDEEDLKYLTKQVFEPKTTRKAVPRGMGRPPIIPVSKVTPEMLSKISIKVSDKVYDSDGTSCHQCRQKTRDQKTSCRNPKCVGVQGQFCGVCIRNRYGEDAAEALLDPDWVCFVCRGICNCSFCRKKQGKRPTGILTPLASKMGYTDVNSLLVSLQGEGDFDEDEEKIPLKKRKHKLLSQGEEDLCSDREEEVFKGFDNKEGDHIDVKFLGWGEKGEKKFEFTPKCKSCSGKDNKNHVYIVHFPPCFSCKHKHGKN